MRQRGKHNMCILEFIRLDWSIFNSNIAEIVHLWLKLYKCDKN